MSEHQLLINYYTCHRGELLAFVSSRLGGAREEAEDIVQNVFLRLLTCHKLLTEITLPALVYTTARHLITDYYRRRQSYETYEHYLRNTDRGTDSAESILSIRDITEQLERSLARLPESSREVYRLHIYGGMKTVEISQYLGEGYKRVEHWLGDARRTVRHDLLRYA